MDRRVAALVSEIDRKLRALGDPRRAAQEKRYLKSSLEHLGTTLPAIHRVVKEVDSEHSLSAREAVEAANLLWAAPVHDRRAAAVDLLERYARELPASSMRVIERLVRESLTWALVDGLAASVVGELFTVRPEIGKTLDRWAAEGDFWLRRAAMLSLLSTLRHGDDRAREQAFARFCRYADTMLDDAEFFIRKAIGWVLREAGKRRPDLVERYVTKRIEGLSGLSLREAIKSQPDAVRKRLLAAKAHAGGPTPSRKKTKSQKTG